MILKIDPSCAFCERPAKAAELRALDVPLFEAPLSVCASCADDLERGGRRLEPFEPRFLARTALVWPGPEPSDLLAALAAARRELAKEGRSAARALVPETPLARPEARRLLDEARAAGLDNEGDLAEALALAALAGEDLEPLPALERRVERIARTAAVPLLFGVYAHLRGDLDAARYRYLEFMPHRPGTELEFRIAALSIALRAARRELAEAEAALRPALAAAAGAPATRDPRLPLLQALVQLEAGNLDGGDRALALCGAWLDAAPGARPEVRALFRQNSYARAAAAGAFARAKDHLREYVKLRPADRAARIDLAHAYVKCSLDPVAREVLSPLLDEEAARHIRGVFEDDPSSDDALLLYTTCLARLGEAKRAWTLLRDRIERAEGRDAPLESELLHVAGLCAHAQGDDAEARRLLLRAYDLGRESGHAPRALRANLTALVQAEVSERLLDLPPDRLAALVDFVAPFAPALVEEYSPTGIELMKSFAGREISSGFATHIAGPEPIDSARFRHEHASALQAYLFLAKRRLGDAVRSERRARSAGSPPLPLLLLLRLLGVVRRAGRAAVEPWLGASDAEG